MDLAPGSAFGPFRVVALLGSGGMASVYRAYDESLDRHVALKVVHGAFLGDPAFAERFRREAKVVARLEHPHIVPIHAFGVEGGIPWMAMRLVTGGAVSTLLAGGRLPVGEVVRIVTEVASALDYAHASGVVHRDVKPQNMLLDDARRVYLADFGIARLLETSTHLTATGMIQGTPAYMAPEQATGQAVDSRADVYALGIVAYEALTGRVPFTGPTPVSILLKQVSEPVPRPPASELPFPITTVLERCLAKKPEERFDRASDFAAALQAALVTTLPSTPPPVPRGQPAPAGAQPGSRPRGWALLLVVLVAVGGAAGVGATLWFMKSRAPVPTAPPTTLAPIPVAAAPSPPLVRPAAAAPIPVPSYRPSPAPSRGPSALAPAPAAPPSEGSGPFRLYCEARPHAEVFGRAKPDDVADSTRDLRKAIARRSGVVLVGNPEEADAVVQILERGRTPPLVGMRQVRVRLVVGNESIEITGQDSFGGFNTWSGAAGGALDRVESWLRANRDRVMRRREAGATSR